MDNRKDDSYYADKAIGTITNDLYPLLRSLQRNQM